MKCELSPIPAPAPLGAVLEQEGPIWALDVCQGTSCGGPASEFKAASDARPLRVPVMAASTLLTQRFWSEPEAS